jgi:hypothetical protein
MRLWTLHPRYLDARGLVALWREALLAQKVLQGATRGYRHHPQLARFRIDATRGQLLYEWRHLRRKLERRDPEWYKGCRRIKDPVPHALFRIVPGGVPRWPMCAARP